MDPITDDERAEILRLHNSRLSISEIVKAPGINRPYSTIKGVLVKAGLADPLRPNFTEAEMDVIVAHYKKERSIRRVAHLYASSYGTIRNVLIHRKVELRRSPVGRA